MGSVTLTSLGYAAAAAVGTHSITPSVAAVNGTFKPTNYTITYTNGTLNITPTSFTFTATATVARVCDGGNTGEITVSNIIGGVAPYSISKDNNTWIPYPTNDKFTGMTAGTRTIWVKDVNNYATSQSVIITSHATLSGGIIGANQVICNNTAPAIFTNVTLGNGGIGTTSYQWQISTDNTNFTDITNATNTDYTHTALTATTYFRRTFSNTCGNANSNVITAAISPLPTITGTFSVCVSSTTTLVGSETPHASTPWTSATTSVATVDNLGIITGVAAGSSVITYMNTNGCSTTATVTVNAVPTPTLTTSILSLCIGTSATYTTEESMDNYVWHVGDATIVEGGGISDNTITLLWETSGIKTQSVNYTNTNGCTAVTPTITTITVIGNNTITLTTANGEQTMYNNNPITPIIYNTTGATGATITNLPTGVTGNWDRDIITISGTPTILGTYNYTITLTGGCETTNTNIIGTIDILDDVFTLTFNAHGGTVTPASKSIKYNELIGTLPTFVKTGYSFRGWKIGNTDINNTTIWRYTENQIADAQLTPKRYKVTFEPGTGTNITTTEILVFYDSIYGKPEGRTTLTPFPKPKQTGRVFEGWFTSLDHTGIKITEQTKVTITHDTTLYAKFTPVTVDLIADSTTLKQNLCIYTPMQEIHYLIKGTQNYRLNNFPDGIIGTWEGDTLIISGTPLTAGEFHASLALGEEDFIFNLYLRVRPESQVMLISEASTDEQIVTLPNAIAPIQYTIKDADGIEFVSLPTWLTYTFVENESLLTLNGQPKNEGTHHYL